PPRPDNWSRGFRAKLQTEACPPPHLHRPARFPLPHSALRSVSITGCATRHLVPIPRHRLINLNFIFQWLNAPLRGPRFFDSIEEMERVYDQCRGAKEVTADAAGWRLERLMVSSGPMYACAEDRFRILSRQAARGFNISRSAGDSVSGLRLLGKG